VKTEYNRRRHLTSENVEVSRHVEIRRLPLARARKTFREAYQRVSGVCRTVRGPGMSAGLGQIQILGVNQVAGEKVFTLRFLQGRNPDWVHRPFFARLDPAATWWTDLKPAFGRERFFFDDEAEVSGVSGGWRLEIGDWRMPNL